MTSLISFFGWAGSVFFAGLLVFVATPLVVSAFADYEQKLKIMDFYVGLATKAQERTTLMARENRGVNWNASSYDAKRGEEKVSMNGQKLRFNDTATRMSRLKNHLFGICHERYSCFIDARDLILGEIASEKKMAGDLEGDGEFSVRNELRAADMKQGRRMIKGDSRPTWSESAATFIKNSLEKYRNTGDLLRITALALLFLAGFVPVWYVMSSGGGGGGGAPTVPMPMGMLDVVGVLL